MNSQHLKNSRIAFCAYCVNVERDTFYPPHNNIAEVETGIRRIVSLTPAASLLHCSVFLQSTFPALCSCCSKSSPLLLTFNANYSTFSEKSGSKPLLHVLNYSDAEPESIEQDCRGQETETHLARN